MSNDTAEQMNSICQRALAGEESRALVELWVLCNVSNDIVTMATSARRDADAHIGCVSEALGILGGDASTDGVNELARLGANAPLAVLSALDARLFERSGRYFPPRKIDVGAEQHWLVLRSGFGVLHPRHRRADESLEFFMPHFSVVPCQLSAEWMLQPPQVSYSALAQTSAHGVQRAQRMVENGAVQVVAAAFSDSIGFVPPPKGLWRAADLSDPELRWQGIESRLLDVAKTADVVVFPELTVTPAHLKTLMKWLRDEDHDLCWVVAGSFHVIDDGKCYNRSCLLDASGNQVVWWDKLLPVKLEAEGEEIREDFTRADVIRLLATPLGLIGNPICRDYCEEADGVRLPWMRIPVDFLFVPSMGDAGTLHAHSRAAAAMLRHGTVSVVANQDLACHGVCPGFVCAPGHDPDPAPGQANCVLTIRLDGEDDRG